MQPVGRKCTQEFITNGEIMENANIKRKSHAQTQKKRDVVFIWSIITLPLISWLLFYVYLNFNMVLLAFQEYDVNALTYKFSGFTQFGRFLKDLFSEPILGGAAKNSLIVYGIGWLQMPLTILVSFCIYKKIYGASIFRVILFLPSIISGIVWVLVYKYIIEYAFPIVFTGIEMSLLVDSATNFGTIIAYGIWLGFAGNMVLYTGAMSRVPVSLVEYGKLDGLSGIKEFWYLTLPLIFPTVAVFITTGVVGIFSNSLNLYSFYGSGAPAETYTFGYYFFIMVFGNKSSVAEYPYASAAGLMFTLIAAPLTLGMRWFLNKITPEAEF